jgi:hypothetical protein
MKYLLALIRAFCVLWWEAEQKENLSFLFCLLGEKDSLDVGEDTSLGNGDSSQQFVQFFVVTDGQLQVTGDDPGLLVVTGGVTGQFKNLSCQVFHDGGQVDGCSSSDTFGIVSLAEKTMDTTNGELKSSTAGSALCLSLDFASFTTSRHVWLFLG